MKHRLFGIWLALVVTAASATDPAEGRAQDTFSTGGVHGTFVGSEMEQYLRVLQVAGVVEPYPWSIRGFSPAELDRLASGADAAHPWASRYALEPDTMPGVRAALLPVEASAVYNSTFPYGFNDGAVWAGRGFTAAVRAGAVVRWGPVSVTVAPIAFVAQNAAFELDVREGLVNPFADPKVSEGIDRPQRFGDEPYARIDPGQTTARVDFAKIAVGMSTANQHWGPVVDNPLVLGSNAPGFVHAFLGTGVPIDLFFGKVHGRVVWGRLGQSPYATPSDHGPNRFMSGAVGVLVPRGIPGLEIGGGRFFHAPWPADGVGIDDLLTPFGGILKKSVDPAGDGSGGDAQNQIASIFARWLLPSGGAEFYGEYVRDDHSWDVRDLLIEPDHLSGYVLGFRKAWHTSETGLLSARAEVLNTAPTHLRRVRQQWWLYAHSAMRQGHTHLGQLLGSEAAYGGGGARVVLDAYSSGGRWSAGLTRTVREVRFERDDPTEPYEGRDANVLHALELEALRFVGRADVAVGLTGAYEADRGFREAAWNASARIHVRVGI